MGKTGKPRTVEIARSLVEPLLEGGELELWDVRFEKEGSEWYLRYFIDKPGGVTIGDLEALNHALSDKLDEVDPIDHGYTLEVSSPGLERELVREEHFARYAGSRVRVRLFRAKDGKREWTGALLGRDAQGVRLRLDDDSELLLEKGELAWVRLDADIESGGKLE